MQRVHDYSVYRAMLMRATTPKIVIMAPETRLIHFKTEGVTFFLSKLTLPLRISHHNADPANTLKTNSAAEP